MSVRLRLSAVGAATAVAVVLLTGCSSPIPTGVPVPSSSSEPVVPADQTRSLGGADTGDSGGTGGFTMNPDCMGVLSAYSTIALALVPSLSGGTGTYDAGQVASAISGLGGKVPDALKGDFQVLSDAAKAASGKSMVEAGQILGTPAVSAASDDISKWTDANCG